MQATSHQFGHSARPVVHALGQFDHATYLHHLAGDIHILSHATGDGTADDVELLTQVIQPTGASGAAHTRNDRSKGHDIAEGITLHLGTHFHNLTAQFVTENPRDGITG